MSPVTAWFEPAVLSTAFLAGLLGGGHCFAMCGGIAAGLGAMSRGKGFISALQFNASRLFSYMVLGSIAALLLGGLAEFALVGNWLRLLTAVMILMIGLRLLVSFSGLEVIEKGGAKLWKRVLPLALKSSGRQDWIGRLSLGMCWGFLPCGLVYSVLLTAASTGSWSKGALTMLVFGLGTLPAMLGLTVAAPALTEFLQDKTVRKIIGFSLLVLALWMFVISWSAIQGHQIHVSH